MKAMKSCSLKTLSKCRSNLCLKFAEKCIKNEKTRDIFPTNDQARTTRVNEEEKMITKTKTDWVNLHLCRGYIKVGSDYFHISYFLNKFSFSFNFHRTLDMLPTQILGHVPERANMVAHRSHNFLWTCMHWT